MLSKARLRGGKIGAVVLATALIWIFSRDNQVDPAVLRYQDMARQLLLTEGEKDLKLYSGVKICATRSFEKPPNVLFMGSLFGEGRAWKAVVSGDHWALVFFDEQTKQSAVFAVADLLVDVTAGQETCGGKVRITRLPAGNRFGTEFAAEIYSGKPVEF